ncbi:MAG: GTPase [Candidatus Njordarchaeales archaeon]
MSGKEYTPLTRGTWRKFWQAVKEADIVLEVLDSRDPLSFRLPIVEKRLSALGKKVILVINKADLVPRDVLEAWKREFEKEYPTIYISARYRLGTGKLRKLIYKIAPKGKEEIKVAIIGYPNVGKSSIINILKGSHSAPTGAKPGLTRHLQIVRRGRLRVLDTPGVFPYEDADTLVYKGAIRVETLDDPIPHAIELINRLKKIHPDVLKRTYGFDADDPLKFLEELAKKRGRLLKGGVPDVKEAARTVLRDWQTGKIVIWVRPEDYYGAKK